MAAPRGGDFAQRVMDFRTALGTRGDAVILVGPFGSAAFADHNNAFFFAETDAKSVAFETNQWLSTNHFGD